MVLTFKVLKLIGPQADGVGLRVLGAQRNIFRGPPARVEGNTSVFTRVFT